MVYGTAVQQLPVFVGRTETSVDRILQSKIDDRRTASGKFWQIWLGTNEPLQIAGVGLIDAV
jgi:hypothetical protein